LGEGERAKGSARCEDKGVVAGRKPRGLATPLSPRRYKLQVTIGQEARDKLAELQNLLSHQIPDGDPAAVVERALDVLLSETKKKRVALTDKPRARRKKGGERTRAIPAQVRREVFRRDEGRCAFMDGEGRRCESAWQLEFHHCVPYGREGPHSTGNIELRCRAHNQFEAELEYGRGFMAARRRGT
jgi:5-methylcytosine-specific restriction endonuclease McrA